MTKYLAFAFLAGASFGQDLTPQQLKAACESAPANTITINVPVKISGFSSRVNVNSGCRVLFGVNGFLEADSVNMGFAGPLVLQGGLKSGFKMANSLLEAPSATLDLAGGENIVDLSVSTLRATAGSILINTGAASQLVISSRFSTRAHALMATGAVQVNGAAKLDASLSSTSVSGTAGISIAASGNEMTFNVANSNLIAPGGPISIVSPGVQASFNYAQGRMQAGSGISVSFSGNEGQISLQQVVASAGTGSASFVTALGGARPAKSIVLESTITAGGSVNVHASLTGQSGEAALESSRVTATGEIAVRSGPLGTTNVKINRLQSSSLAAASTGPSGSCTAEGNTVIAPARALCI
ncbi:MAG: hypothetical protein SFV51_04980 [Bryobacteraceae bacterium]|nr:hypothetical protein [Bryobacteraceae bacterium]